VFNNLITNAIEHTPEGSEIVVILDATGDSVAITVADSGPGIPAEEMATLFTPFVTAKRKRRLGSKSMGLGLAISKKIVEAHGGAISAKNSPDGGALFTITLPFEMGKEIGER